MRAGENGRPKDEATQKQRISFMIIRTHHAMASAPGCMQYDPKPILSSLPENCSLCQQKIMFSFLLRCNCRSRRHLHCPEIIVDYSLWYEAQPNSATSKEFRIWRLRRSRSYSRWISSLSSPGIGFVTRDLKSRRLRFAFSCRQPCSTMLDSGFEPSAWKQGTKASHKPDQHFRQRKKWDWCCLERGRIVVVV